MSLALTGRRVVVTGGAGFLGSFVVEALGRRGVAELFVPRRAQYDLVHREACRALLADTRPDVVFHLAARVGGIGANRRHPGLFLYENAAMGLHLVEEARLAGVTKLVMAGTVCAYPKHTPVPFREADLWNGYPEETNAPYGLAKRMLLAQSQAYRAEYGFDSCVLFPVNLYGPRDNFDLETSHVIPAMIHKFVRAKERGEREVTLWGDGSPTREFCYVADTAEAFVLAAERYESSEPVNVGSGVEISIRDLAALVQRETGFDGALRWDPSQPNGQPRRRLDVSRAKQAFGFEATTTFEAGLRETVRWFLANRKETPA